MGGLRGLVQALLVYNCLLKGYVLLPVTTDREAISNDGTTKQTLHATSSHNPLLLRNLSTESKNVTTALNPVLRTTVQTDGALSNMSIYSARNGSEMSISKVVQVGRSNTITGISDVPEVRSNNSQITTSDSSHESFTRQNVVYNPKINQGDGYEFTTFQNEQNTQFQGDTSTKDKGTHMNKNDLINVTIHNNNSQTTHINITPMLKDVPLLVNATERNFITNSNATANTTSPFLTTLLTSTHITTKSDYNQTKIFKSSKLDIDNNTSATTEFTDKSSAAFVRHDGVSHHKGVNTGAPDVPVSTPDNRLFHSTKYLASLGNVTDISSTRSNSNRLSLSDDTTEISTYRLKDKETTVTKSHHNVQDIMNSSTTDQESRVTYSLIHDPEISSMTAGYQQTDKTHINTGVRDSITTDTPDVVAEVEHAATVDQGSGMKSQHSTEQETEIVTSRTITTVTERAGLEQETDVTDSVSVAQETENSNLTSIFQEAEVSHFDSVEPKTDTTNLKSSDQQTTVPLSTTVDQVANIVRSVDDNIYITPSSTDPAQTSYSVDTDKSTSYDSFTTERLAIVSADPTESWDYSTNLKYQTMDNLMQTNDDLTAPWDNTSSENTSVTENRESEKLNENDMFTSEWQSEDTSGFVVNTNGTSGAITEGAVAELHQTTAQIFREFTTHTKEYSTNEPIEKVPSKLSEMPIDNTQISTEQPQPELITTAIDALIVNDPVDTDIKTTSLGSTSLKHSKSTTTPKLLTRFISNDSIRKSTESTTRDGRPTRTTMSTAPYVYRYKSSPTQKESTTQFQLKPRAKTKPIQNRKPKAKRRENIYPSSINDVSFVSIVFPVLLGMSAAGGLVSLAYFMRDKTCSDLAEEFEEKHPELYDQTLGAVKRKIVKAKSFENGDTLDKLDLVYSSDSSSSDDE